MAVRKFADAAGITELWSKVKSYISGVLPTKTSDLTNDSGYITGMEILSYGISTWDDFTEAYNAKKVVYCRASSNSNPASGSQTRLAFMAYVNNAATPTEVEFQYYRSINTHTESQQGDQVFVYKLTSANKWTVITREAASKVAAGGDLTRSYSNGTVTISGTIPTVPTNVSAFTNDAGYVTTDEKVSTTAVTSGSTYYPTLGTNTTSAETKYYDNKGLSYVSTQGSSNTSGSSILTLGRAAGYGTANGRYGQIDLYSQTGKKGSIYQAGNYTADRTYTLPNKSGTIALTSDIPTVPTNVSAFTNDAGYITSYDLGNYVENYSSTNLESFITTNDGDDNARLRMWNDLTNKMADLTWYAGNDSAFTFNADHIGAVINWTPTNDLDFTTKEYVDDSIGAISIPTKVSDLTNDAGYLTIETDPTVPSWAKASSKPSYTASEVGAVPTTRKVNNKALSSDVTLNASDVGAQETLVSGTNIKTINSTSLLGSGNVAVQSAITSTTVSITVANWNATTTCTKSVTGVTSSNNVIVTPVPASINTWNSNGVYCSAQGSGTLTFTASTTPSADMTVNVMIIN